MSFLFSSAINRFSHEEAHLFLYPILDFTDRAKTMEIHLLNAYYEEKDFVGPKALQTVQKALNDSGDEVNLSYINKHTIKFLNFWMPENFVVINSLQFKQRGQTRRYMYFVTHK